MRMNQLQLFCENDRSESGYLRKPKANEPKILDFVTAR